MQVDDKQRYLMITEAAYFLAERRNFEPGHEHEDWLAAERQVEEMLKAMEQHPAIDQMAETKAKPGSKAPTPKAKAPTKAKATTGGWQKAESTSAGNIPSEAMSQPSSAASDQSVAPTKAPAKRSQRKKTPSEEATPMSIGVAASGKEESKPAAESRQKKTEATTTAKGDGRRRARTKTVA